MIIILQPAVDNAEDPFWDTVLYDYKLCYMIKNALHTW